MTRIVKDPVERRREIMNKSSELFLSKGSMDKTFSKHNCGRTGHCKGNLLSLL